MRVDPPQIRLAVAALFLLTRAIAADPPYPPSPVFQSATFAAPASISAIAPMAQAAENATSALQLNKRLYIWIPEKDNSQLAWSEDGGATWTPAAWKLSTSFGYPAFLDFGNDYQGPHNDYVYIYSHDHHNANDPADRMVLARVKKDLITRREAYEFLGALEGNQPYWVFNVEERTAVFTSRGRCLHSSISYHAPTKRYLWVQILPPGDSRHSTGLGIYDAPEPWGPWTTVFYTEQWDAPLDSARLPAQSMSPDGRGAELVFSNSGAFLKRRIEFQIKLQ